VDMPTMSGYELVRVVKGNPNTAEIPFLFFSAHHQPHDRIKGLELGANDYIAKPFIPREVCLRVRNMLTQQMQREKRRVGMMVSALDLIQLGIVLLDKNGRIELLNRNARELLDQKDGLYLRDNHLLGDTTAQTHLIEKLVAEAAALITRFDPANINPLRLSRPSLRRDFALIALPLDISEVDDYRAVSLIIHDPETTNIPSIELLVNAYNFTKAEAKVASLLIQGKSISEICADLAVSRNTVCSHLKKLFSKTHTQRQSDFTRFLLSGLSQLKLDR